MKRHHKSDSLQSSQSSAEAVTPEDEKAASIAAALAKLKDPPSPQSIVGAVIKAGETEMPVQAHNEPQAVVLPQQTKPTSSSAEVHDTLQKPIDHDSIHKAQETPKPLLKKAAAVTEALKSELLKDGPLDPKDLLKLGEIIKQNEKAKEAEAPIKTETIAPTAPDPEATIAFQIAEKKRIEAAEAAAREAEKWHVTPAKIKERQLNKKQLYKLLGLWLGAIPTAFILYTLARLIAGENLRGLLGFIIMTPIYAIALYGLVGWIPLVLLYMRTRKV